VAAPVKFDSRRHSPVILGMSDLFARRRVQALVLRRRELQFQKRFALGYVTRRISVSIFISTFLVLTTARPPISVMLLSRRLAACVVFWKQCRTYTAS
jgi:hypothetical protein